MGGLLIPISDNEFKSKVNIKFNNILDGLNSFKNFTIIANNIENGENKIIEFIEKIFEDNNCEVYVDFYINKLSAEDKERLFKLTPVEDKEILKLHLNCQNNNGIFYKVLNKDIIPFLVRLNTREIFFVTFYFTHKPITIWGNYGMKFPCFVDSKENLEFYFNISKLLGLTQ